MTRTLLLGPAGSGKTRAVLDEVRPFLAPERGRFRSFLFLVPTYSQAEHVKRRLLRESPGGGLLDRGVVTFEQLAERRTGVRLESLAPRSVRDAVLAAAFDEVSDPAFRDVARFAGLRRAALRLLDEIKALEPDPAADVVAGAADRIAAAAEALSPGRAAMIRALVRVLAVYERRRLAEGLRDHGDLLRGLLRKLRDEADPPPRVELFVMDGFTDLTPVQSAIVERLAHAADRSVATLLGDAEERIGSPFGAGERLRRRLVAGGFRPEHVAARGGASSDAPVSRRFGADLARLERRLAGDDVPPAPGDGSVRLLAGADPDDEADRVARTALRWTTEGIARGEILVVVRSLASATAVRIVEALRRHGVPAHRFGGEPLATVPCVRSARRVMRLVASAGDVGDLVEALRHGDARGVEDVDADRLGRLVRERGARDEAAVLALAREAGAASAIRWIETLAAERLDDAPRAPAETAGALLAAVPRLVRLRFHAPFDDADEAAVARDAAAMRALRDLAGAVVRALRASGSRDVAPAGVAARIDEAIDGARFTAPDHRDDVVHVVDAEEARQWETRAVIVAGLRTGEFPATAREDVFLTDPERAAIDRATGLRLPDRRDDAQRREALLFYAAATRATERLVLTCPVVDDSGNPVLRSTFLEAALSILPPGDRRLEGAERSPGDVRPAPGETLHRVDLERTALAALTERFADGAESEIRPHTGYALLPHLVGTRTADARPAHEQPAVRVAARWFAPPAASLRAGGAARQSLAEPRARSATALSDFAQCPYRHFARKGLALDQARAGAQDGLDALLVGTIVHAALERVVRDDVRDPALAAQIVDEEFARHAGHLRHDLGVEAMRAFARAAVADHVTTGAARGMVEGFVPRHIEWKFGPRSAPVVVGGEEHPVALNGAADRIDVAADGRAIVLDYKWSRLDRYRGIERKIEAGADLQLPIYAIAARRALGLRVVAVGYVTLRDGETKWLRVTADAPVRPKGRAAPPAGWGEGDGEEGFARAEAHVVELDRRIRDGACEASPLDEDKCGAARCPFADLCRFEGQPG